MITVKQLKIFEALAKQPFAELTRKQVKQSAKERSNNALAIAIKRFLGEGVIMERKVGKSALISLNFENEGTYYYLGLANAQRLDSTAARAIRTIRADIEKYTFFYSLVIFGSFAVREQKKASDLDIAVLIESEKKRKHIEAALNSAAQKSLLPIDAHVITKDEFVEMLVNGEENLGKQIARKHLAVHNHQIFYSLIKEGMKHGFRI